MVVLPQKLPQKLPRTTELRYWKSCDLPLLSRWARSLLYVALVKMVFATTLTTSKRMVISDVKEAVKVAGGLSLRIYDGHWVIIPQAHEWIEPRDSSEIVVDEKFVTKMAEFTDWADGAVGKLVLITGISRYRKKILHHFRYLQALSHRKSDGTNKAIWLFGGILFGCLAEFCLVIWRKIVWLFGGKSFGYLAEFCLVIWR